SVLRLLPAVRAGPRFDEPPDGPDLRGDDELLLVGLPDFLVMIFLR
ncbi:MAG: hypothetical protein RL220_2105, partial [Bacteroidota bacterium]